MSKTLRDRVAKLVRDRRIPVAPVMPEDEIRKFEEEHSLRLPEDYRWFLLRVGGCCVGPPNTGLMPLDLPWNLLGVRQTSWPYYPKLGKPFPFTQTWVWEEDEPPLETMLGEIEAGSLYLGSDGCTQEYRLIVAGSESGNLWEFTQFGIYAGDPRRTFLEWFLEWAERIESSKLENKRRLPPGNLRAHLRRRGWELI